MAENVTPSLPPSPHQGKQSLWKRSKKILDAKQITFLQPLLKPSQDKSAKQGRSPSAPTAADPSRRREQVRHAQRTHRQRTQNYMKALEQEVIRLREVETHMVGQKETLQSRVNALEHTLFINAIPAPPDTDKNTSSTVNDYFHGQAAKVTLRNDGVNGERLHVHIPSSAPDVSPNLDQRANASVVESQAFDSSESNWFTDSYKDDSESPILPDATIISKEWLDSDALASPQSGIEFVLALERPCMSHINTATKQTSDSISGHALTTSFALCSHAPSTPQAEGTWTFPRDEIEKLLHLSSRLELDGQITPVEAWNRICQHCGLQGMRTRAFKELELDLCQKVHCYGFGAALEESVFEEALITVLAAERLGNEQLPARDRVNFGQ